MNRIELDPKPVELSAKDALLLRAIDIRLGRLGSMQMFADNFINTPNERDRNLEVVAENVAYYVNKRRALEVAIPELLKSQTVEVVQLAEIEVEFLQVYSKAVEQLSNLYQAMLQFGEAPEGTDEYVDAMDALEEAGFALLKTCQQDLIVFQGKVDKQAAYLAYRATINERDREAATDLDALDKLAA